jgi:uncharacterized cupredoxin-like copper-binding protein
VSALRNTPLAAACALCGLLLATPQWNRAAAHDEHQHAAHADHAFAAGEPGTTKLAHRIVEIVLNDAGGDMVISPDRLEVSRGEQVMFVLKNAGAIDHEFLIDTIANNAAHQVQMAANPDMHHDDPNGRRLKPGETAELIWRFTRPGSFEMACLIPGHYESGMKGAIVVK